MNKCLNHILASLLFLVFAAAATAQVWDGTTNTAWYNASDTTFTITTAEELAGLASLVNGGNSFEGKTVILGADIVLNENAANYQNWGTTLPARSWVAINSFQGTFDGNGHVVSGVYINTTSNSLGLFSSLGSSGTIKNVGVVDSYIKGNSYVGGLVGNNYGTVSNSYSTGAVTGTSSGSTVGGLVGNNYGTVSNSYSTGTVTINGGLAGGLVGYNIHNVANVITSYYDNQTSGRVDAEKGTGKTTEDMQSKEFVDILNAGADILSMNAWIYSEGKYPTLSNTTADVEINIASYFASGDGTEINPYIIKTKGQLEIFSTMVNLGRDFNGEYFKLGNNIALNDTTNWQNWGTIPPANFWVAIGSDSENSFRGTFDGDGKVVSGIYISTGNSYQGLFGHLGSGGTIKNIGVVDSYIRGYYNAYVSYVGGLVGYSSGTVSNSYSNCTVTGSNYVGGLVGHNYYGTVSNSYSSCTVTGRDYVGGLIGYNYYGTVSNSYSTGIVTGTGSSVGGLIGSNSGTIKNSYYDSQTSGQTDTRKGEGKTTAEMQSQEFTNILNIGAGIISMNSWVYSAGKYPVLSNTPANNEINFAPYFASGDGTEMNPYIIKTKEQLEYLSLFVNLGNDFNDGYFKLGNNIALNDTTGWQNWETTPPDYSWTAIGNNSNPFGGTFDGNSKVISGIYINSTNDYQGLFGYVNNGTIKNVGVVNSYINGFQNVGGLVGENKSGTIANSYYIGGVTGSLTVGGLVGRNESGTISNSYFTGDVTGTNYYVGGLVGQNYGTVSNSYSTGTVVGTDRVGGLVGSNRGTVSNSYATGTVTGSDYVGGLVGYNDNRTIRNSYSTGTVTGNDYIGGLVGWHEGTVGGVSNSYYDTQTSGQTDTGKGEGKTTSEMQSEKFTNLLNIGASFISMNAWVYSAGKYPELTNTPANNEINFASHFASGDGTETNPYIIKTKEHLEDFFYFVNLGIDFNGKYFKLGNDIALNGNEENPWMAIVIVSSYPFFQGTFDGDGYVVSGIYINSTTNALGYDVYKGLFKSLGSSGTIKNLGVVVDFYTKGGSTCVGGLVGLNEGGTIINSYSSGTVVGINNVGGLVGCNRGTVINSYSTSTVTGDNNVGGLVGNNAGGTVSNSYSAGTVTGSGNNVGGLVGSGYSVTNSYYDTQTSGQTEGFGTGKTTAEMQSQEFTNLLNIGASFISMNTWVYSEGKYPTLSNTTSGVETSIASYFASGDGTEASPYIIKTRGHLEAFSTLVNFGIDFDGEYVKLGNNIALNDTVNWQNWGTISSANSWTAIGNYNNPFRGNFDGSGYVVSGVYINTTSGYQGLFGYSDGGVIKNLGVVASYIKGSGCVGGLIGYKSKNTLINSYFIGTVTGTSTGNYSPVGGLVGGNSGIVSNSYSVGTVTGNGGEIGGLVGSNSGTVSNSYSAGTVTGNSDEIGGLVGYSNAGRVSNSYYDTQTSGQTDTGKGEGKTTAEMQSQEFVNLLNTEATSLSMNAWIYSPGKYPVLSKTYFASGNGTETNPYIIKTKEHLENLSHFANLGNDFYGKYFKLGNDIALSGTAANPWIAIGNYTNQFKGTFDGDGHVVSGVYINATTNYQGLFGYLGENGTIKNVGVIDSYIKGNSYVGGLAGVNDGTVINSYFIGTVIGNNIIGGLVGYNYGSVKNNYSISTVTGSGSNVGGLVGGGFIETNSYYEIQTGGQSGSGKTAAEMKQIATYKGWDFGSIWDINDTINNGYPYLNIRESSTPIISHRVNPLIDGIEVQTISGGIVLTNIPSGAKVEVYSLNGKRIYHDNYGNSKILKILVAKGMYIVRIGTQTHRVAVR